jgi:peroxiredoxin
MQTIDAHPTLSEQLAEFKAGFKQRATPERVATMEAATGQLRDSGIEQRARRKGDRAPDVLLRDEQGRLVQLSSLWKLGPLVIVFYRGGWCPYCNLELRAWQRELDALKAVGGRLVAISPQTPDNSMTTAEKNELAFPVLSDSRLAASDAFGISFHLPPELVDLYASVGHDLPVLNGNGQWVLPIPATYVIDTQGEIVFSHVESDYRLRAEPSEVLQSIDLAEKCL